MKLMFVSVEEALANEQALRQFRMKGNMVCLCSDHNRKALKRKYYLLANYFMADGGEFITGGCSILRNVRSAYLDKAVSVLNEEGISYSFSLENPDACGGQIPYAKNGKTLSNDEYTYAVYFESEEQKQRCEGKLKDYCTVRMTDGHNGYLLFNDILQEDAVRDLVRITKTAYEDAVDINGHTLSFL